ncbi:MAG: CRISPR-associated protein Csx16 [Geminicoccaceae bacterium]
MACYFVSRHEATRAWAARHYPEAELVEHLDVARVAFGDRVLGTLPVHVAAAVCARGAEFEHLVLDTPLTMRGAELDEATLSAARPRLERFDVQALAASPDLPRSDEEIGMEERAERAGEGWRRATIFTAGFALLTVIVLLQGGLYDTVASLAGQMAVRNPAGDPAGIGWPDGMWGLLGRAALLFGASAGAAGLVYRWRHRVISSVIRRSERVRRARVSIQGLSDLAGEGRRLHETNRAKLKQARAIALDRLSLSEDQQRAAGLDETERSALEAVKNFRWQQNIRALAPHLGKLEHVVVITSERSDTEFDDFAAFVRGQCARAGHAVHVHRAVRAGVDYEDYETLSSAIREAIRLARRLGADEREIVIDATAGQKIFSIAAAIATVNRNLVFTYVNNKGVVRAFDASMQLGDFG